MNPFQNINRFVDFNIPGGVFRNQPCERVFRPDRNHPTHQSDQNDGDNNGDGSLPGKHD